MHDPGTTRRAGMSRRTALRGAVAAATAAVAGYTIATRPRAAHAHNLQPSEFADTYESAISRPALHYQLYQFPNIQNAVIWSNIRNGLNGSQFSYGEPAGSLQVAVQGYDSGNIATYNDAIWEKYQIGAKYNIVDPRTSQPATRNVFYPRRTTGGADLPLSDPQSLYNDIGMAALMERGVIFLT
jgi:hypothetical protein